jgi:hypothetical protein
MSELVEEAPIAANWRDDAVWVQNTILVRRVSEASDGSVIVQRQTGEKLAISAASFYEDYFAFGSDGVYKPAFRPVRAICFDHAVRVPAQDGLLSACAGDAIVEQADGTISVLPRSRFDLAFRIVGHGGPNAPVAPFLSQMAG